jgi:hypothetical protein
MNGVVHMRVSPRSSAWSVTTAKSSGRRRRTVRPGEPSAANGWRPSGSPRANRYASRGVPRVPWPMASNEKAVCTWVSPKNGRRCGSRLAQAARSSVIA